MKKLIIFISLTLVFAFLWQPAGWAVPADISVLRPLALSESKKPRAFSLSAIFKWMSRWPNRAAKGKALPTVPSPIPESEPLIRGSTETAHPGLTAQMFISALDEAVKKFDETSGLAGNAKALREQIERLDADEQKFIFEQWPFTIDTFKDMMSMMNMSHVYSGDKFVGDLLELKLMLFNLSGRLPRALKVYRESPVAPGTQIRIVPNYEDYTEPRGVFMQEASKWGNPNLTFAIACEKVNWHINHIQNVSPAIFELVRRYTKVVSFFYSEPSDAENTVVGQAHVKWPGVISLNTYNYLVPFWTGFIVHESRHQYQKIEGLSEEDLVADDEYTFDNNQQSAEISVHTPYAYMLELDAILFECRYYIDLCSNNAARNEILRNPFIEIDLKMAYHNLAKAESILRPLMSLMSKEILTERGERGVRYLAEQTSSIRAGLDAVKRRVETCNRQREKDILSAI